MTPAGALTAPMDTTWLTISTPSDLAQERPGDRAERDAGGRLAGAGAFEDRPGVVDVVLLHAGEVGVPGRGRVSGALRACAASRSASTGSADITVSHFGHSVLPTRTATGPPMVSPCRTPPVSSTSSCSNFIRAPRP